MASVLKRLEEMEHALPFGVQPEAMPDFKWLLRLTRALLVTQTMLVERVEHAACACDVSPKGELRFECFRCRALDQAEKVRKGEV